MKVEIRSQINGIRNVASYWVSSWEGRVKVRVLSWIPRFFFWLLRTWGSLLTWPLLSSDAKKVSSKPQLLQLLRLSPFPCFPFPFHDSPFLALKIAVSQVTGIIRLKQPRLRHSARHVRLSRFARLCRGCLNRKWRCLSYAVKFDTSLGFVRKHMLTGTTFQKGLEL